jgi:hypothetical protein
MSAPRPNWDFPTPSPASECAPSPNQWWGGTHTPASGGWGSPNLDDLRKSIALCANCHLCMITTVFFICTVVDIAFFVSSSILNEKKVLLEMLFCRLDGDRVGASAQRLLEAVSSHSPQGRDVLPFTSTVGHDYLVSVSRDPHSVYLLPVPCFVLLVIRTHWYRTDANMDPRIQNPSVADPGSGAF